MTETTVDYAALAAQTEKAEKALPKMASRGRTRQPNPFDALVQESYSEYKANPDNGEAGVRQVPVGENVDVAKDVRLKIFNAAGHFEYGANFRHEDGILYFRIVDRAKRGPRKAKAEDNGTAEPQESNDDLFDDQTEAE